MSASAIRVDADAARKRSEAAKQTDTGVRMRPGVDGMAQLALRATATDVATALACLKGRAAAMTFDDLDLTQGQKDVAALLHALAGSGVWSVDVRMPVAVALGLSDHPAVLAGYGPIGAPGEVLAVDAPVRIRTWTAGDHGRAAALRHALVQMATTGGTIRDLRTAGYVPSEALGRLVELRDVTSTFPGDSTPARSSDRDHRLPHPLGPTDESNLQNLGRRWHRAKHTGWDSRLQPDGTITWTGPTRGVYHRRPKRTIPPPLDKPDVFFTVSHFDGYPAVLVRLEQVDVKELEELVTDAWLARAPKRLATSFLAKRS